MISRSEGIETVRASEDKRASNDVLWSQRVRLVSCRSNVHSLLEVLDFQSLGSC